MLDPLYMVCDSANIDSSGACSAPLWVQVPSLVPPLSASDAVVIASAILVLWAVAFSIRSAISAVRSGESQ